MDLKLLILFRQQIHNFGSFGKMKTIHRKFYIKNTGLHFFLEPSIFIDIQSRIMTSQ